MNVVLPTYYHQRKKSGFTLIEMMVVIVIFMVLTSGTVITYSNFLYRQQALQSAKNVQEAMRAAQKKARSGEKPPGCVTLQGYRVSGGTTSTHVTITAVCTNATYTDSTYPLVADTRLTAGINMTFTVITGGVTGAAEVELDSHGVEYAFSVNPGGNISEGEYR